MVVLETRYKHYPTVVSFSAQLHSRPQPQKMNRAVLVLLATSPGTTARLTSPSLVHYKRAVSLLKLGESFVVSLTFLSSPFF